MMWTLLMSLACSDPISDGLPQSGLDARDALVQALKSRDSAQVERATEAASKWEGKDAELDRLMGDALANVLMHVDAGLSLLESRPAPNDPSWARAVLLATARTGNAEAMAKAWTRNGRDAPSFTNAVTTSMVQRLKSNPHMSLEEFEAGINACALLDAQPSVGRKALEFPVSPDILKVAPWVGADSVILGRPKTKVDSDPVQATGPIQCSKKVILSQWPKVISTTLTIGLASGARRLFIDVKQDEAEQWSYATSDPVAGGHWIQAMHLARTPDAETRIRSRFADGLWAKPAEYAP